MFNTLSISNSWFIGPAFLRSYWTGGQRRRGSTQLPAAAWETAPHSPRRQKLPVPRSPEVFRGMQPAPPARKTPKASPSALGVLPGHWAPAQPDVPASKCSFTRRRPRARVLLSPHLPAPTDPEASLRPFPSTRPSTFFFRSLML